MALYCSFATAANGQTIQCFGNITNEQVIQYLLPSQDFAVTNIQFHGVERQRGGFLVPSENLGVVQGLLLSTGDADISAIGENLSQNAGIALGDTTTDADLLRLLPYDKQFDVAVIECDFLTNVPQIKFHIVLGSEEHCTYERTGFNDVAGIFLSGPNINGNFGNNAINLAATPDGEPLTVQTFNPDNNPQRYLPNPPPDFTDCGPTDPNLLATTGYNGLHTPIRTEQILLPNQTYHLKIAIADIRDGLNDSGLFVSSEYETSATAGISCQSLGSTFALFPSPTDDLLNIVSTQSDPESSTQIRLFDTFGKLVDSIEIDPINQKFARTFHLLHHPAGIYFVQIRNAKDILTCPITKF